MKALTQHITERLQLNKDRIDDKYMYFPKTKDELEDIIKNITSEHENDKVIDLNMIDTSKITDMSGLFYLNLYNYDISQWDVSNVEKMHGMFYQSGFNNDISQWDVSKVTDMTGMFKFSKFNQDISDWNVSSVNHMFDIFYKSRFNQNLTSWKSKIKDKDQLQYIQDYIK